MLACPTCQSENVFITRAEAREYFDVTREVGEQPLRDDQKPPPGQTVKTMPLPPPAPAVFSRLPPTATCRDCGATFTHDPDQCPPPAELVELVRDQVVNRTHVAGLYDGAKIKDYAFWTEAEGLAYPVTPAERYAKLYNMATLARFGSPVTTTPPPAAEKPKRRPAAKKPAKK